MPVPGKMVARTRSFDVVEINSPTQSKNRKIISKSNIDQPDFQKHVVTDDHVLDLIMHLTEGQLQMLGLGEQTAKIEKLKTKSKTENSKFQKLKCIDQSQGRTQVQEEHRYKDHAAAVHAAAARHQEELSMMPETPYHRKRKEKATKEWGEVKSKIKKMYHKKGSSAAKKVTSTWLDQLSEHDHTNSVSSNSNAWATILEEGRVTVEKEMKERSKKFDTAKIKMNYKLEDQQDQQVKLKKAKEKKLVEKQLKALQEMRFQREQIELKKELVRRKAIADQEELDRRGEEARKKQLERENEEEMEKKEMDDRRKAFMEMARRNDANDETVEILKKLNQAKHEQTVEELNIQHVAETARLSNSINVERNRQKALLKARLSAKEKRVGKERGHL